MARKGEVCGNAVHSLGSRWECEVARCGLFWLLCVLTPSENRDIISLCIGSIS